MNSEQLPLNLFNGLESAKSIIRLCACGCGKEIIFKKRDKKHIKKYLPAHCQIKLHTKYLMTDELKKQLEIKRYCKCGCNELLKINKYHIIRNNIPEYKIHHWNKKHITKGFTGRHHTNDTKEKIRKITISNSKNPDIIKKISDGVKQSHINNPELRKKLAKYGEKNGAYGKIFYPKIIRDERLTHFVRSSWELTIALLLKENNINYEYEYKTFKLNGCTYTPDFYIPEKDLYIEVKGPIFDKQILKMKECVNTYNINFLIIGNKRLEIYFSKHNFYPKIIDYYEVRINAIL